MNEPEDLSALSHLAPELARTIVSISGDIALVLDDDGVILNVALQSPAGFMPMQGDWVGQRWVETVTGETRGKIEQLLREVRVSGLSRRREVNHPSTAGADVPIAYAAIRLGENGPVLAVGRDLRAIASIQQRFVETQQEMERDYWKHRQAESRYRLLFQVATDAVLVVDAESLRVVDANQATAQLFDLRLETVIGKGAAFGIEPSSRNAVEEMLATARATGRPAEMRARVLGKTTYVSISATPFRSDNAMLLLVRARAMDSDERSDSPASFAKLVERTPDGVLITDSGGRVLTSNKAFLTMCGASHERDIRGKSLADWISPSDSDLSGLIKSVKLRGIASPVRASLLAFGRRAANVEITAALLEDDDQESIGFTIRKIGHQSQAETGSAPDLAESLETLMARVGTEGLPLLVREGKDLVERHLITLAIQRFEGDRSATAELLGISRAQLDLRLRHHRLIGD